MRAGNDCWKQARMEGYLPEANAHSFDFENQAAVRTVFEQRTAGREGHQNALSCCLAGFAASSTFQLGERTPAKQGTERTVKVLILPAIVPVHMHCSRKHSTRPD
jgi:hypothetical protein